MHSNHDRSWIRVHFCKFKHEYLWRVLGLYQINWSWHAPFTDPVFAWMKVRPLYLLRFSDEIFPLVIECTLEHVHKCLSYSFRLFYVETYQQTFDQWNNTVHLSNNVRAGNLVRNSELILTRILQEYVCKNQLQPKSLDLLEAEPKLMKSFPEKVLAIRQSRRQKMISAKGYWPNSRLLGEDS